MTLIGTFTAKVAEDENRMEMGQTHAKLGYLGMIGGGGVSPPNLFS
jgi:hypothetical protein